MARRFLTLNFGNGSIIKILTQSNSSYVKKKKKTKERSCTSGAQLVAKGFRLFPRHTLQVQPFGNVPSFSGWERQEYSRALVKHPSF